VRSAVLRVRSAAWISVRRQESIAGVASINDDDL